jgi:drug/metabolite transporter (DMT)-like permease
MHLFILLGAQLAVGAAAIFARYALEGTDAIMVSALRLVIASAPLVTYTYLKYRNIRVEFQHEILMALAGFALACHFATWIDSLLFTSVAVSTLLVSTSPVWTALYDVLILKKRMPVTFWLALAVGLCGVVLITANIGRAQHTALITGNILAGNILATAGGIALASYLILIRFVCNRYPTGVIVSRTYSWAALLLLVTALVLRQPLPADNWHSWAGIIAMAIISQMLGHTGINAALKWFQISTVAFSTLLEPIFAGLLAWVIFSEVLSIQAVFGSALVLVSLAVILRLPQENLEIQDAL